MHHTLDQFTDNPIIDEIVCWPPREQAISSIRASAPMFRNPFVEITLSNGETFSRSFIKSGFAGYWAEAKVILETLTTIELVSEFKIAEYGKREDLVADVLAEKEESLHGADLMFDNGMYQQYLWQFGSDYKDLPEDVKRNISVAQSKLAV